MPQYIRALVPGGTFFFTVALLESRRKLLTENLGQLREALKAARRRRPFTLEAIVILPDHLHRLWNLPSRDEEGRRLAKEKHWLVVSEISRQR